MCGHFLASTLATGHGTLRTGRPMLAWGNTRKQNLPHCQSLCCRANSATQPIKYFSYRLLAKSNNYFIHNHHKSRHDVNRFLSSTDHYHTLEIHDCLGRTALQDSQWGHWDSSLAYPSGCKTQSVTDVNTAGTSCGGK